MRFSTVRQRERPASHALALLLLGAFTPHADALDPCLTSCETESGWCANDPDPAVNCGMTLQACYGRCINAPGGSGNGGGQSFGAIALSPTTMAFGYTYGFESQAAAENAAVQYCREDKGHPKDCKSILWFYNTCGALAIAPHGKGNDNYWGSAWADAKRSAERQAMGFCAESGAKGCRIAVSYCSR